MTFRNKSEEGDRFEAFIQKDETALIENSIPHAIITDNQPHKELLARYKVIVLANVRSLSDAEVALIKEFIRIGGNIVATYETSLFNSHGVKRQDFGLAEVFGCSFTGEKMIFTQGFLSSD